MHRLARAFGVAFEFEEEFGGLRTFGFQFLLEAENLPVSPTFFPIPGEQLDDEFGQVVEVGHRPGGRGPRPA